MCLFLFYVSFSVQICTSFLPTSVFIKISVYMSVCLVHMCLCVSVCVCNLKLGKGQNVCMFVNVILVFHKMIYITDAYGWVHV